MHLSIFAAVLLMATTATEPAAKIDTAVREGMQRTGARGLAVAFVEDGRVVYQRSYGDRNAKGEPLTDNGQLASGRAGRLIGEVDKLGW